MNNLDAEALIETLELMSDPEAMATLYAGVADVASGRVEDAEAVFADLGW